MFAKEDFDILPEYCKWDHAIELIPRVEPKSSKVYPLSPLCKSNWAQDSRRILSYITVCNYDTTHLQENPQRLG